MKKILLLVLILTSNYLFAQHDLYENGIIDTNKVLTPEEYHSKVNQVVTMILTKYHYKKTNLNDSLSAIVYDNLIETLDHNKVIWSAGGGMPQDVPTANIEAFIEAVKSESGGDVE